MSRQDTWTNSSCEKWHSPECLFNKTEAGCKFEDKCAFAHRRVESQPSKESKKNGDKSVEALLKEAKNLGCVSQDTEPPKSSSILRKSSAIRKPIRTLLQTKIRDQNSSLNRICPSGPRQRNPNAPKFEDWFHEEREKQDDCVREATRKLEKRTS